ncbi:hypothetical protein SAMN02746098_01558 [Desulfosporosinus lacus DSM 15449]|uniref:Uncharacterized protein n=1 Tax=Desulfosporosinus lacus DSM 15449 TaxID=1121420 RepID=A0A1M5WCT7_9FIRM|nr:hypothetical protein SAMN02746098_01558 [Desulfosporosinus lacus DSM 15449]
MNINKPNFESILEEWTISEILKWSILKTSITIDRLPILETQGKVFSSSQEHLP